MDALEFEQIYDDSCVYRLIDRYVSEDDQLLWICERMLTIQKHLTVPLLRYTDPQTQNNALQLASKKGMLSVVKLLLHFEHQSEIGIECNCLIALRCALLSKHIDLVVYLTMKTGSLLKKEGVLRKEVESACIAHSHVELLHWLISNGHFNSFLTESQWKMILSQSTIDIFIVLLQHFDRERELYPDRKQLLVSICCKHDRLDLAEVLFSSFHAVVRVGDLCFACYRGHLPCVQYLVEKNGESVLNNRDYQRYTPLVYAIKEGHFHIVAFLKKHPTLQFDEIMRDPIMEHVLHNACFLEKFDIVRYLLNHGVNPEAVRNAKLPAAHLLVSWMAENGFPLRSNNHWAYDLQEIDELDVPFHRLAGAFWFSDHKLHADKATINRVMMSMGYDCCDMVASVHNENSLKQIPKPSHTAIENFIDATNSEVIDSWSEMGVFDELLDGYQQWIRSSLLWVTVNCRSHRLALKLCCLGTRFAADKLILLWNASATDEDIGTSRINIHHRIKFLMKYAHHDYFGTMSRYDRNRKLLAMACKWLLVCEVQGLLAEGYDVLALGDNSYISIRQLLGAAAAKQTKVDFYANNYKLPRQILSHLAEAGADFRYLHSFRDRNLYHLVEEYDQ